MTRRFPLYILALSILSCAGCSRFEYDEKLTVNKEAFSQRPPRSLAVLPFANAAKVKKANELAREQIYAHLAPLNYQDTELSKVDTTLSNLSVRYQLEPDEVPPPLIRRPGLADAILSGEFAPGSRLDEQMLAGRFGVSRTPVREVLRELAASGLVEMRPRRGTIVAAPTASQIDTLFGAMAELEATCARLSASRD